MTSTTDNFETASYNYIWGGEQIGGGFDPRKSNVRSREQYQVECCEGNC